MSNKSIIEKYGLDNYISTIKSIGGKFLMRFAMVQGSEIRQIMKKMKNGRKTE